MTRTATLFSRLRTQGQDTVCQEQRAGQGRVLAQETALYSQHQVKNASKCILIDFCSPFSMLQEGQISAHLSSAFIFMSKK